MEEEKIPIEFIEHEPVFTNPTMALALGVKESQTVKSLVLKTKEGSLPSWCSQGTRRWIGS